MILTKQNIARTDKNLYINSFTATFPPKRAGTIFFMLFSHAQLHIYFQGHLELWESWQPGLCAACRASRHYPQGHGQCNDSIQIPIKVNQCKPIKIQLTGVLPVKHKTCCGSFCCLRFTNTIGWKGLATTGRSN